MTSFKKELRMIELSVLEEEKITNLGATIKVMGIGGAGSNAVNSMVNSAEFQSVEFIVSNTDLQALQLSPAPNKIQLGAKITKGLGAGSNPDLGRRAAEEDFDAISQHIMNTDILFLTAGLGGGTGTGALPVIANAAKELGILTVVVVTKPFSFEGKRRAKHAEEAIESLRESIDTLIVIPNQRLLEISEPNISMLDAFSKSNDILKQAIKGIVDIITKAGHINVDFADVRAIMKDAGMAIMGTGRASGENRAEQAALAAINSPLIENSSIAGARGILINITGNVDLGLQEISQATTLISQNASDDANIILGSAIDATLKDEIVITVIATGFQRATPKIDMQTKMPDIITKLAKTETLVEPAAKELDDMKFDLNDFDTPTFMRKKAVTESTIEKNPE
jgi:cell division protein FtsZ